MARSTRRRRQIRQLAREARVRKTPPPEGIPVSSDTDVPIIGIPVDAESPAPEKRPSPLSQADTAELAAQPGRPQSFESDPEFNPAPPAKLEFSCPCGGRLVANREMYDKRTRCGSCGESLLVNLLFNPATRQWEIQAFRVNPIAEP